MIACVDIGGTSLRVALWNGQQLLERRTCSTPQPALPNSVLEAVLKLLQELLQGISPTQKQQMRGVGVATSGVVINAKQISGSHVTSINRENFPAWDNVDVSGYLSQRLDLPCMVLNDARSAAWGEFILGAGQAASEFMFITVSTGVGAGMVLGGNLHLAANGLDTELGWVQVPALLEDEPLQLPQVGQLGALELESSGDALGLWASRLGYGDTRALCDAAESGDQQAEKYYQRSASLLAWKIADCAATIGIARVALGGSVGLRLGYLQRVQSTLQHFPELFRPQVVHARLGSDAGLIGAALWLDKGLCLAER